MSNHIIIDGCEVPLHNPAVPTRVFEEKYIVGTCGVEQRRKATDLGVIHYTAGEGPADRVYRVLKNRGLSVHFVIDRGGIIHQYVDPGNYRCAHAGGRANSRSVGIEVVSYGHARGMHPRDPARPTYTGTVHGWTTTIADFYPVQYAALDALCRAVSLRLPIDLTVPLGDAQRLSTQDLAVFHGWCGHYHVERLTKAHPKIDPGPRVFEELARRWGIS